MSTKREVMEMLVEDARRDMAAMGFSYEATTDVDGVCGSAAADIGRAELQARRAGHDDPVCVGILAPGGLGMTFWERVQYHRQRWAFPRDGQRHWPRSRLHLILMWRRR